MNFDTILHITTDEMTKINQTIVTELNSDVALINQLGTYIINSGGKKIRPLLTILVAKALHYQGDHHIVAAAFIEFIHTATLLHDDVVDESDMRRGHKTANATFGNAASVLVGDFIYTRSFQMMIRLGSMKILQLMSDAVNVIAEGEVMQLMNCNDPNTTEDSYMQVIYSKTARLFEAASQIGAILSGASDEIELALQNYGKYLGTAFQLIDDVMDYSSDLNEMGKNLGDDLAEGKPTLPLLHAMRNTTTKNAQIISQAILHADGMENFDQILAIIKESKSLEYTKQKALKEAQKAIDCLNILEDSQYKQALISLALLAVQRTN